MRLAIENYPTPQGKTCDVVDLDRDGGEGRPLIVARFFEPEYAAAFAAFPALLAALETIRTGAFGRQHKDPWAAAVLRTAEQAVKAAGGE